MKKSTIIIPSLIITSLAFTGIAIGDDDREEYGFKKWFSEHSLDVAPVKNERYKAECGSCHFAYQPGLLPAWLMWGSMGILDYDGAPKLAHELWTEWKARPIE